MTYIITALCLRDSACVDVCPVECIIPGKPEDKWPWFYIDPETCIDCGACVPECPYEAIFPEDETPEDYEANEGDILSMPAGTPGYGLLDPGMELADIYLDHDGVVNDDGTLTINNKDHEPVTLRSLRLLEEGEEIDLTEANAPNYNYFDQPYDDEDDYEAGMGYDALEA